MFHLIRRWFRLEVIFIPLRPRKRRRRPVTVPFSQCSLVGFQSLEPRIVLSGNPVANNDSYVMPYYAGAQISAPGVLANDTDPNMGATLFPQLVSGPSHASNFQLNQDGSFYYATYSNFLGQDSFTYDVRDNYGYVSNVATVTLNVEYSVASTSDLTKQVAIDPVTAGLQVLSDPFTPSVTSPLPAGGSGGTEISAAPADGAPATAHNLSLAYNSVAAQPDATIQGLFQFNSIMAIDDTVTGTLTFNGVRQPATYSNLLGMNGNSPDVDLSYQVSTANLPTGRYPYTLTLSGNYMSAPATISGAINVVNEQSSPFGAGWNVPGLNHLYQNSVPGVPAGVLLTNGTGDGWYFTGSGPSYTSPAGPHAYDTLTAASGGGWQLLTHQGVAFNFDANGNLLSRVERTGATTTYNWTSGLLTSIVDPFGRAVDLSYASGLLTGISDYAGSDWQAAHSGAVLTSVTEPNPGGGAPVWQYAYHGDDLSTVTDPNGNTTTYIIDSHNRLSGVDLPGGATTSASSEQSMAYGGPTESGAPDATPTVNVDSTTTDANGNQSAAQTDVFGNPLSAVDAYGNQTSILRNANGMPTQITLPPPVAGDPAPVTNISYDATGDVTSAGGAQPGYGTYTYAAAGFGQWATFTDSTGDEWTRTFDGKGDILTETDPSGAQVSWTYDGFGRPLTMTMPAPNDGSGTVTVNYHYDADERLTEIVWPDASNQQFGYNADDRETSSQDENGHTTSEDVDVLGRVTSVTNASGGIASTVYDKDNNVISTEDALGNTTSFQYNSRNELIKEAMPPQTSGGTTPVLTWTYDGDGNELTSTDSMNRTISKSYDKLDRLIGETMPAPTSGGAAPTVIIAYDNLSRKVSDTDALGGTTTWAYANADVSQLTIETEPPPGGSGAAPTTSYFYDADGRQNQVENALDQTATTTFTVNGQTAAVKDNLGGTTTNTYGNGGELLSTTDALNHMVSDEYDSRFRLIQTTNAAGGVTQITLDPVGNETKLVDPDGNATSWTYSPVNLPLTETNSLGTTTTAYNLDHEVTSIEDADGRVRDFEYDNDQRLTAENWMSGSTIVASMNYGYDIDNELTSASDPNSAYAFAYNGDGQVTSVNNAGTPNVPNVDLTSGYDLLGDRASLSATIAGTADFANTYAYDGDQNLTMVQQQGVNGGNAVSPKEIDYGYNALGQFTSATDYNFIGTGPRTDVLTGAYSYDNDARLTGIAYTSNAGGTTIDTLGWGYDAASNATSFTSIDGTATYGYDPTNQLTSATYNTASGGHQPTNESFSFDANGDRNMSGYTTGSDNLMSSDGTYNYKYDADGNTISRTQIASTYSTQYLATYAWDYRNRLTDVEYYDNNAVLTKHVHYVYGVFDHLLATEVDPTGGGTYTQIQNYVLDVSPQIPQAGVPGTALAQPLLQFDANQNLTVRYLVGLDPTGNAAVQAQEAVPSTTQAGPVTWAADDSRGTPRDLVDNSGAILDHTVTSAFGQSAYNSNPSAAFWAGFGGGHFDLFTGDVNDDHRWYAPSTGRWLAPDPSDFKAGDAVLNRYAGNDPVGRSDPTGLEPPGDRFGPGGPYYNPNQRVPLPPGPMPLPEAVLSYNPYYEWYNRQYTPIMVVRVRQTPLGMEVYLANGAELFFPSHASPFGVAMTPLPPTPMIYSSENACTKQQWMPYISANLNIGGNFTGSPQIDYGITAGGKTGPNPIQNSDGDDGQ